MRRRAVIVGLGGLTAGAGCIGVNTETRSGGADPTPSGDGGDGADDYAGGENTPTTTTTPDYPRIDAQRAAIRGALNGRRVDEGVGELDVNSADANTLRQLAQDHAELMAGTDSVDMNAGGSLFEAVEREHGTCQFQASASADRFSGAEVIFLGRVEPTTATEPETAADAFLGHWLGNIDTRPVLLSGNALFLGLGVAYGVDGLYVAMILC